MTAPIGPTTGVCVTRGADGYLYQVRGAGAHRYSAQASMAVLRIDPGSLTTVATTTLPFDAGVALRSCALHGDQLAIGGDNGV